MRLQTALMRTQLQIGLQNCPSHWLPPQLCLRSWLLLLVRAARRLPPGGTERAARRCAAGPSRWPAQRRGTHADWRRYGCWTALLRGTARTEHRFAAISLQWSGTAVSAACEMADPTIPQSAARVRHLTV